MSNSREISLTDADLDLVTGGVVFLPIMAGVLVGAALGAAILVGVVVAADGISHATGGRCVLDLLK